MGWYKMEIEAGHTPKMTPYRELNRSYRSPKSMHVLPLFCKKHEKIRHYTKKTYPLHQK
jgi:hypothetical protein